LICFVGAEAPVLVGYKWAQNAFLKSGGFQREEPVIAIREVL
jgi:hypothetical protein